MLSLSKHMWDGRPTMLRQAQHDTHFVIYFPIIPGSKMLLSNGPPAFTS